MILAGDKSANKRESVDVDELHGYLCYNCGNSRVIGCGRRNLCFVAYDVPKGAMAVSRAVTMRAMISPPLWPCILLGHSESLMV